MTSRTRKTPLYKPAVYAKLLNRPDVTLYVLLQNELELSNRSLTASSYLACHFGFFTEGMNVHIGIPSMLWNGFVRIEWQSYNVDSDEMYLCLNYDVQVEETTSKKTSYGTTTSVNQAVERLSFRIPCCPTLIDALDNSSFVHIREMDANNEVTRAPSIPITKIAYNKG